MNKSALKMQDKCNTPKDTHLSFGVDLNDFVLMEQVGAFHHLAGKVESFTLSLGDGAKCEVTLVHALLQFSVHCKDPHQAAKIFKEMINRGELRIPGECDTYLVAKYLVTGEGEPIHALLDMADDDKRECFISDNRCHLMKEIRIAMTGMKTSNAKETATKPNDFLAIGFDLDRLALVEQAKLCYHLVDQIERFAQGLGNGFLGTVTIICGLLQVSVHSADPKQALMHFLAKMESGEIDVPENDNGDPVFNYVAMGKDDPVNCIFMLPEESDNFDIRTALKEDGIEMSKTTDPLIQAARWALGKNKL
jgi:hypothetical protein